jgi:putative membrane-bound dehydrogenase-like protein
VKLAASEPEIRQPVTMSFDDRGRLWVIQYLQYPNPAGLKPVNVDQYLRTKYDRLPEPPPRGPRGEDRITILEDKNGDGHFQKVKDFVTGLNLASGMAIGYGGVFVAQPPYLLFYPDKNGDDVPDSDPEVLLTGFGLEDAHALANSLQWGPDGWLYGAQGSTVTANIRGISFQQGIWRYQPITKEFELFAEGGGNTWGLDFDRHGNAIAGTNYGNSTMLHQVQGAYYVKGFAKHGELHNPHAYGYFEHVPYKGFKGGHVTCGGIVYRGGSYPKEYENTYIACNPLANAIYRHSLTPFQSSFTSRFEADFAIGNDTWFRPVDLETGPDGSIFVADWYDKRINHVDPVDNWDRTNGRIYKIEADGTKPVTNLNLAKLSSNELIGLLSHKNIWFVRQARQLLAERRDPAVIPTLRKIVQERTDQLALESLWALYVSGGFEEDLADRLLGHANEDVRTWTVRLLGDTRHVSQRIRARFAEVARTDPSCTVRCQLACTCKRLPGPDAIAIVTELLSRTEDLTDPCIPMLLWWVIENKAGTDRERVLSLLEKAGAWNNPFLQKYVIERLARRYMAERTAADLAACARLLELAPGPDAGKLVVRGMDKALEGQKLHEAPALLLGALDRLREERPADLDLLILSARLGSSRAYEQMVERVRDSRAPVHERQKLISLLGQMGRLDAVPVLLTLLKATDARPIRLAVLTALEQTRAEEVWKTVLSLYPRMQGDLRGRAQTLLCSRAESARALLEEVDRGAIDAREISFEQLRRVRLHNDPELSRLLAKHWGTIGSETTGQKRARIASIKHMLGQGKGDPHRGHEIFKSKCAICHTLFGEGNKVGPELTGADRRDTDFLVTSIVDPSAVIRKEYTAYVVSTMNGRLLTGLIAESTPKTVTLLDEKNERRILARDDIEEIKPSAQSLMPEKLLDDLDDQETRDFFSYLQSASSPAQNGLGWGQPKASKRLTFSSFAFSPTPTVKHVRQAKPLTICLVSGSLEYHSDESLAAFQQYLESHYPVRCVRAFRKMDDDLPGLENLDHCDVMVLFTRRLTISGEQLERIKEYCRSGKPIVAIRTASHAFQNWLALDKEVLGGNYQNHYGAGPAVQVRPASQAAHHMILSGVGNLDSPGSLYRNQGIAGDTEVLLTGSIPGHEEPVAWTRVHDGGRIFYTSLGHPADFKNPGFLRLLANAIFWTTGSTPQAQDAHSKLELHVRSQALQRDANGHAFWQAEFKTQSINPEKTAIVICDMWDKHWSKGATERVGEMAPRMDRVLKAARAKGITIIHAPSETMNFYARSPARKRVLACPGVPFPPERKHDDPPQPIDAADGGSDTGEKPWYKAWTRQHPAIEIDPDRDAISDNGQEIWNFMHARGIENVLIMGVHTNMCVLGRSFAIKSLVRHGMPTILVRDLTDTMYNPASAPYVSHDEGTRLVVEYIEKFWCPTIDSKDLLGTNSH